MITKRIPLFQRLEIETHSSCNRRCPWCIRNSTPDKDSTRSWFESNALPTQAFKSILDQAIALGFRGDVCLSHYNEPLLDKRIPDLVEMVKARPFSRVFFGSNADALTEELAAQLDGVLDELGVALYIAESKIDERAAWIKSLFHKTHVTVANGNASPMITHYSPLGDHEKLAAAHINHPCQQPIRRMIVNHKGEMLMCCDDLINNFELGNIHDNTLEELWYSEQHQDLVLSLHKGRSHPHCQSCPRP